MATVLARCVCDSWDSTNCVFYHKGQDYQIDPEGPLAALTIPNESGRTARLARYCFVFDRSKLTPKLKLGAGRVTGREAA